MRFTPDTPDHWARPPDKVKSDGKTFWIGRCTCGAATMGMALPSDAMEIIQRHAVAARNMRKRQP